MKLTVANISTQIKPADFQAAITAIGTQLTQHFQPEWNIVATIRGVALSLKTKAPIQGDQDAIIYLGDSSQDPTTGVSGALGYHSVNHSNIPYGFVYLDICAEYNESWSCTLSHETLELAADPSAVLTVSGPAPKGKSGEVYYDLEVCDPTQGDNYNIGTVNVSNFVGRAYFGMGNGTGNTNYLNLPLQAFGVRPGGYFQYEQNGKVHQVMGDKVSERMLAAKRQLKTARRNERRRERLEKTMVTAGA